MTYCTIAGRRCRFSLEAANAREGIKTEHQRLVSRLHFNVLEAANAREGIKTSILLHVAIVSFCATLEAANAREGIKTPTLGPLDRC